MSSIKLFVKDGCPRCPAAKEVAAALKKDGCRVVLFDLGTAEGLAEGVFYGVMATPTILVVDQHENLTAAWRGTVPALGLVRDALHQPAPSKM